MTKLSLKLDQIREKYGFPITTAKRIFNTEYPEEKYLVNGLIPFIGLLILCGPAKSGKSFLMLLLGHAISAAMSFLGISVEKPHTCLYLSLEDSERRLKNRIKKMGLDPNDSFLIVTRWSYNQKAVNDLRTLLAECPEIEVIIIDTLGAISQKRETTGFQADYDFMNQFKNLADQYKKAFILTHHTRKMRDDNDIYNDILGSVANIAVADTILLLQRPRNSSKALLSCISRDFPEKAYELNFSANCTWEMVGEASPRASTPERQKILDVLIEHGELRPSQIAEYLKGQTPKNIANLLALMREEGLVVNASKRGYWRPAERYAGTITNEA
jgi:archaellum biogenesis ATPase FlaH